MLLVKMLSILFWFHCHNSTISQHKTKQSGAALGKLDNIYPSSVDVFYLTMRGMDFAALQMR